MIDTATLLWHYLRTKYRPELHSREYLLHLQDQKVCQFLEKILPHSEFYREYYAGIRLENWREFPLIDKSKMMANFDNLNTVGITKAEALSVAFKAEETRDFVPSLKGYTVGLSSGTSGNRGLFLLSRKEQLTWAGIILAKMLPYSLLTKQRIAFFLRANSTLYQTVQSRQIALHYFDLLAPFESHIERLNRLMPTMLVAPPSILLLLAEAQPKLHITPIKIVSIAEVLDPLDEMKIVQAFGQPLHEVYQCTEGLLASTCQHGTLHLNEENVAIQKEYLDQKAGIFVPIITDFQRRTQPILRYRLDDVLHERRSSCPCGSPTTALERIEGRCDDIFYLPSQIDSRLIPFFADFITRTIITTSEEIQEYRVVQKQPNLIEISLQISESSRAEVGEAVAKNLHRIFSRADCQQPELIFLPWQTSRSLDKKLRRVERSWIKP